ncbi:MAG: substrate-binding domain-containing protein [Acidobacteriota bacterium]
MKLPGRDASTVSSRPSRPLVQVVARACDILAVLRSTGEVLKLAEISARVGLPAPTAFRVLDTLCAKGLVERPGRCGYRFAGRAPGERPYKFGFGAQSSEFAFSRTLAQSVLLAGRAAHIELVVLNNRYSRSVALKNADHFVREKTDLVIEFQTFTDIAPIIASKYHDAGIPMIAVEIPHPGATFYGADNYRAGQIGGRYLGKWARKHWGGRIDEVLVVEQGAAGALPQSRLTGTLDGIVEVVPHLDYSRVVHIEGHGQYHASLTAVRKHLKTSSSHRTLIGAVNDPSAIGALRAFEEAGRGEDCAAVSQNASEEAREEMRRPDSRLIGSVAYFPENYGPEIISLALDILHHKSVPPAVFTRHHLITPDNVGHFYAHDNLVPRG